MGVPPIFGNTHMDHPKDYSLFGRLDFQDIPYPCAGFQMFQPILTSVTISLYICSWSIIYISFFSQSVLQMGNLPPIEVNTGEKNMQQRANHTPSFFRIVRLKKILKPNCRILPIFTHSHVMALWKQDAVTAFQKRCHCWSHRNTSQQEEPSPLGMFMVPRWPKKTASFLSESKKTRKPHEDQGLPRVCTSRFS